MLSDRNLRLDLLALAFLVAAVLLGVSLFTYDAADPPSTLIHPPRTEVANACGRAGAYVAHYVIAGAGFGAFYVLTSLAALGLTLLWRQEVNQPILRGVGWTLSLAAASTIAAMALPATSPGPEIGAGGYLGAMGFAVLESHFAQVGGYILAFAVLVAGLLLCTDYLLFRVAAGATTASGAGLVQVGRLGRKAALRAPRAGNRPQTDLENVAEELGDEEEAGEDEEHDEWEEGEYDEYEYEEEDEDDELEYEDDEEQDDPAEPLKVRTPAAKVEPAPEPSAEAAAAETGGAGRLKDRISSALRIKNPNDRRSERDDVIEQLEAADHGQVDDVDYQLPPLDLLLEPEDVCYEEHEKEVRRKAKVLEKTFRNFGLNVKVVEIETGPVIAQYEIELEAGLRLSKITGLADDLAIALRVPSVRIVAPIPGKNTVGIEVPNETRQLVRLRDVIEETNGSAKRMKIPIYLGKDVSGNAMAVDLAALPHLLIAGRTGTGKSVCLNSIIVSMLMSRGPDEVRMLMIDPKMVELSGYKKLPHLMHPVVTDMRKAEAILAWAVDKMEERYQMLARAGVRHVSVYNQLGEEELRERMQPKSDAEWENVPKNLPFIVIVADEMADLMMTAGKEVEQHIIRLAQKSRAVGIHLILATQKPTVDVITGLIKSNLPARIAFQVASRTDSRVVLDENGADKLLGNGDMLFLSPGTSQLLRGQGTYLSDDEIAGVTEFVGTDAPQFARELIELKVADEQEAAAGPAGLKDRDELYEAAVDVVIREQRGSVSLLQRCLGIGYGRAARLIDFMAEDGIVAEYNGSKAREVLMSLADWEAMSNSEADEPASDEPLTAATVQPRPKRPNRVSPAAPWEDEQPQVDEKGVAASDPSDAPQRASDLAAAASDDELSDSGVSSDEPSSDEDAALDSMGSDELDGEAFGEDESPEVDSTKDRWADEMADEERAPSDLAEEDLAEVNDLEEADDVDEEDDVEEEDGAEDDQWEYEDDEAEDEDEDEDELAASDDSWEEDSGEDDAEDDWEEDEWEEDDEAGDEADDEPDDEAEEAAEDDEEWEYEDDEEAEDGETDEAWDEEDEWDEDGEWEDEEGDDEEDQATREEDEPTHA